jgi:hypothetical protein
VRAPSLFDQHRIAQLEEEQRHLTAQMLLAQDRVLSLRLALRPMKALEAQYHEWLWAHLYQNEPLPDEAPFAGLSEYAMVVDRLRAEQRPTLMALHHAQCDLAFAEDALRPITAELDTMRGVPLSQAKRARKERPPELRPRQKGGENG